MLQFVRRSSPRGLTRVEGVVLLALLGIVALFGVTYLRAIPRRERILRAARDVQTLLLSARASARQRHKQVVVWIDGRSRRIICWADDNANYVQDAGEPTLAEQRIPSFLALRAVASGEPSDGPSAVCFDGYGGNASLSDRVVFQADGTVADPQRHECGSPRAPRHFSAAIGPGSIDCDPNGRCRGIFLTDTGAGASPAPDAFRVGVDDPGQPGTVTILKWLPASQGGNPGENNFVPPPWRWSD